MNDVLLSQTWQSTSGGQCGDVPNLHLKRLQVVWQKQPVYFVTVCVASRRRLLASDEVVEILLSEWRACRQRHGWAVGSYVVMPDHVHFFLSPEPACSKSLSSVVGKWKEWTAKRVLKFGERQAPLWQPEFFDHVLRSHESRSEKWEYVRQNPVRAGLVDKPEDWPYAASIDFD